MKQIISLTINGKQFDDAVSENLLLLDYLRDVRRLTGTKSGCDGGECGACTVLIDGQPRPSCITLAVTCNGKSLETIEGQAKLGILTPLQQSFHENLGTQCGFCTPGMILTAQALLDRNPNPDDTEIKQALSGNLCRCTGYVKIIDSVRMAVEANK